MNSNPFSIDHNRPNTITIIISSFFLTSFLLFLTGCGSPDTKSTDPPDQDSKKDQDVLSKVVESINKADRDISSETTVKNYRIGVTLAEPSPIYNGEKTSSSPDDGDHQLRVVLREKRTKRKLPGASVRATFIDANGNELEQYDLLETWGDYYFYGKNLQIPDRSAEVTVSVSPPEVGRHEDMKDVFVEPVSTTVKLQTDSDEPSFSGNDTIPISDERNLGSDVKTAMNEFIGEDVSGPYRLGFIAEHSEPYWVFKQDGDNANRPSVLREADIPQSANRHLEIVLLEKATNRIVPHADVTLDVNAQNKAARARVNLHFLLSAFNHYGNSLYLPEAEYEVNASVNPPELHTLKKGKFSGSHSTKFRWNPDE